VPRSRELKRESTLFLTHICLFRLDFLPLDRRGFSQQLLLRATFPKDILYYATPLEWTTVPLSPGSAFLKSSSKDKPVRILFPRVEAVLSTRASVVPESQKGALGFLLQSDLTKTWSVSIPVLDLLSFFHDNLRQRVSFFAGGTFFTRSQTSCILPVFGSLSD